MINHLKIIEILNRFDKENIKIGSIGSHTALQILKGAKDEGFETLVICKQASAGVYERFRVADDVVLVEDFSEILGKDLQDKLIKENVILIPHGSFVEYVGARNIEEKLGVPLFGNRKTLEWESDRKREKEWFNEADVRMPLEFKSPREIDRLSMVKFPGAKGGKGYFLAKNEKEFYQKYKKEDGEYTIQEYITGTRFYPHYFYSPISEQVELLGMDIRYESNIDGLARIPPQVLDDCPIEPSYTVTGNLPVVARESLLPEILKMGDRMVESSKKLFPPGMTGPFCIETICTENLEFFAFEISARIVAGTNLFVQGSPYSQLLYDEPMSTGRRIAREIKIAAEKDMLDRVVY